MGHRVIAISRSSDGVRAAVVETRLRRFELKSVLKFDLERRGDFGPGEEGADANVGHDTVGVALNKVLVPGLTSSDSVVVSFPGDSAFIRRLSFPFRDRARIAEVLPVELEGALPTGLDAGLHTCFEKAGDEGNEIIAVGVQKESLTKFVEGWKAEGIDPQHIGMESLELAALLPFLNAQDETGRNRMIIWIDGRSVEFLVARGVAVVFSRSLALGSPVFNGQEVGIAFMREVLLSMAAASEAGAPLDTVHVAGNEAARVAEALAESLSLRCDVLDPAGLAIPGARDCAGLDSGMTRVVALAIGMAGSGGPASLNLRVGEFGAEGAAGLFREKAGFFVAAAVVFALLGIGWAAVRYVGLVNDRKAIEAELVLNLSTILEQEVTDVDSALASIRSGAREEIALFPEWTAVGTVEKLVKAVVQAGSAGVMALKPAGDETADGVPVPGAEPALPGAVAAAPIETAALDTGMESGAMDEDVDLGWAMELESVRIEPRQANFKGEAESIEKVDELMNRLRTDPCFHDVVTESTERIQFQRHQGWQRFSVRLNVDCAVAPAKKAGVKEDAPLETADEADTAGGE